jgi:hypothetical protein
MAHYLCIGIPHGTGFQQTAPGGDPIKLSEQLLLLGEREILTMPSTPTRTLQGRDSFAQIARVQVIEGTHMPAQNRSDLRRRQTEGGP